MKKITFNCFNQFKCIADKCRHTCCVGWEICIDKKSLKRFKRAKSVLKDRFKTSIDFSNGVFILEDGKRCPFLDKNNLCDIIKFSGEKNLCQVCADHPRFRNFFSDRIEEGFGLSCEKATDLLFDFNGEIKEQTELVKGKVKKLNNFENILLNFREQSINKIFDNSKPFFDRFVGLYDGIENHVNSLNIVKIKEVYNSLERIDDVLYKNINQLNDLTFDFDWKYDLALQRLLWYFIVRHVSNSVDNLDIKSRTLFSILSVSIIYNVFIKSKDTSMENFKDIVREYSKEIEYSEDNVNKILDYIDQIVVKI